MNASKAGLMVTTFFSTGQGENHYTVSSPNTYLTNLKKFHKIEIERRCYFYHMRELEDKGYLRRKQRYRHYENNQIRQIPSMTWFTLKGIVWLVRMGVSKAKKVYKNMVTYLKKKDGRSPTKKEFDDESYLPEDPESSAALEGLLEIVTKKIS